MENEIEVVRKKRWTSGRLISYTLLPVVAVVTITILLIPYYEQIYKISDVERRLIWEAIRNIFNVMMVGIFVLWHLSLIVKLRFKRSHVPYAIFIVHFLISISLINFSYFYIEMLIGPLKEFLNSLPLAMGFENLRK